MRLFVGVEVDPALKAQIKTLQQMLKPSFQSGGWKTEDQFHITVKFLGEVPESKLNSVKEAMNSAVHAYSARGHKPFELTIDRLDYFGLGAAKQNGNRPVRVLWLGLSNTHLESLNTLWQLTEDAFEAQGFQRDARPYAPHLTLAQDTAMLPAFNEAYWQDYILKNLTHLPIKASALSLFHSAQVNGKRTYKVIERVAF